MIFIRRKGNGHHFYLKYKLDMIDWLLERSAMFWSLLYPAIGNGWLIGAEEISLYKFFIYFFCIIRNCYISVYIPIPTYFDKVGEFWICTFLFLVVSNLDRKHFIIHAIYCKIRCLKANSLSREEYFSWYIFFFSNVFQLPESRDIFIVLYCTEDSHFIVPELTLL